MSGNVRIEKEPFNPHTTDKEIRCVFHTVVIKMESMNGKFRDGRQEALESSAAVFNDEIIVISFMNWGEAAEVMDILDSEGFVDEKDYCYIDATRAVMYPGRRPLSAQLQTIELECPWLGGYQSLKGDLVVFLKTPTL
jgi:hypothetical protein